MVQVSFVVDGEEPHCATRSGADRSVCGEWLGGSSYGIWPQWRLAGNAAEWRRLTDEERARRRALLGDYFARHGFEELPAR